MIAEAVDTLWTLGWAYLAWIVIVAAVATGALWTGLWLAWCAGRTTARGVKAARAALSRRLPASKPSNALRELHAAPGASEAPSRPSPSWARTKDAA